MNRPARINSRVCCAGVTYVALCFLPALLRLISPEINYFRGSETFSRIFLPIIACQFCILVAMWALVTVGNRLPSSVRNTFFLLSLYLPAEAVFRTLFDTFGNSNTRQKGITALVAVLLLLGASILAGNLQRLSSWMQRVLIFLTPGSIALCVYAGVHAFYLAGHGFEPVQQNRKLSTNRPAVRIVWIIFDELDGPLITERRPPSLKLPAIDKLLAESFSANKVRQTVNRTRDAIPGLLTGRPVSSASSNTPRDLTLRWADGSEGSWRNTSSIFDDAANFGMNSAIVGWYHPYSRVLGSHVNTVVWRPAEDFFGIDNQDPDGSLPIRMKQQGLSALLDLPMLGKTPWMNKRSRLRQEHLDRTKFLIESAKLFLTDERYGLVFLHLPIPHPPGIWDRRSQTYTVVKGDYLDNVALVDRVIGDFRQVLESSSEADKTFLLVTADHGWRRTLWRGTAEWSAEEAAAGGQDEPEFVPFILHMPNQTSAIAYTKPFLATDTRKLAYAIFSRTIQNSQDLVNWMQAHER